MDERLFENVSEGVPPRLRVDVCLVQQARLLVAAPERVVTRSVEVAAFGTVARKLVAAVGEGHRPPLKLSARVPELVAVTRAGVRPVLQLAEQQVRVHLLQQQVVSIVRPSWAGNSSATFSQASTSVRPVLLFTQFMRDSHDEKPL